MLKAVSTVTWVNNTELNHRTQGHVNFSLSNKILFLASNGFLLNTYKLCKPDHFLFL